MLVLVFLLLFSFSSLGLAVRPEVLEKNVRFVNATVGGQYSELAVVQMEFDQDLYLAGESFLCGRAEQDCPPVACVPCDWSSQQPTGCDNVDCCGPAQVGGKVADQVNEWCESPTPYHSLSLGEKSPVVETEALETAYFRFFVPEEAHCQPFQIFVRTLYGAPTFSLSNLHAFPTDSQQNTSWFKGSLPPTQWRFIQNSFVVCPSLHAYYQVGTYSLAVTSYYSASFYVEIVLSPQEYPLQPPPERISCADVPQEEKDGRTCLQDTESHEIVPFGSPYYNFVLPVPSGCHQVTIAANGETSVQSSWLYCLPRDISSHPLFDNAILAAATKGDNRLSFPICSTSPSYVRCTAALFNPPSRSIIFSTVALPHLTPLIPSSGPIPSFGMSFHEGHQAMNVGVFGTRKGGCYFNSECKVVLVPPLSDPLIYWPPRLGTLMDSQNTDLFQLYYDETDVQLLKKTLVAVIPLTVEKDVYFDLSDLDDYSLILSKITNELGESPLLPNDGPDLNDKTQASPSSYLSSISLSSFPVDQKSVCDKTNYDTLNDLTKLVLEDVQNTTSFPSLQFHNFILDVLRTPIAATSCIYGALEAMSTHSENITLEDQIFCRYDEGTTDWEDDACCNSELEVVECCSPFSIEREEDQFIPPESSSTTSMCGVSECADTYFEDLSDSLNHVSNLQEGCSAGINDFENRLATDLERELEGVFRMCLRDVGFQDDFTGTDCAADIHCEQWSGRCNPQTKKCDIGTTQEVEDAFLGCYIRNMSPSLEDHLRIHVLPSETISEPRDSEGFFQGLKSVATKEDCIVMNDPLDISLRSHYSFLGSLTCQALHFGLSFDDREGVTALCPDVHCLGTSCKQIPASCQTSCVATYKEVPSSEQECSSAPTVCPVTGLPSGADCDGTHCVYCPGKDGEDCHYVAGDQNFCENTVACELEGGSVIFGLTEAECEAQTGFCSVDCPGESCRSLDGLDGVCLAATSAVNSESDCEDLQNSFSGVTTVWYEDTICVISSHSASSSTCAELSSIISPSPTWETCESNPITSCDGSDVYQRYLKCFVDLWHPCTTQEECENSGHCTDRSWTTIVRSEEHPVQVQFGSCFQNKNCGADLPPAIPIVGCQLRDVEEPVGCANIDSSTLQEWLTPAMSEMECVNKNSARYGCQLPVTEEQLLWMSDEDCECRSGVSKYAWEWTDGVWTMTGVSQKLQWKEIQPVQKYEWTTALSIDLLQRWLETNEETKFSYALKSEMICESLTVSTFLDTLVCDCLSGDQSGGCYSETDLNQVEPEVGFASACIGEESFVKTPSSRVSFTKDSVTKSCVLVNLSFVKETWFAVPPPKPSISFEFEDKPQRGIVSNRKSASVGSLRGDGSVLSFSVLENVNSFIVCLLISKDLSDTPQFPIKDFGYSEDSLGTIYPLGLENITREVHLDSEFWCGTVRISDIPQKGKDGGNKIRLYPIQVVEDPESKGSSYTSQQTEALMYTLGVCYCICFVLLSLYLVTYLTSSTRTSMLGMLSLLLLILCVFRIVFMFGYPNALFEDNELAEFVVFEIPTFILFSVVIISIFFWKKLATKKKFFGEDSYALRGVIFLGLVFVWTLWAVVTIVYSEVILEEDGDSPCPGRVAPSYDKQKEDTRTLSIVYQSLIISVTFILAAIFCYYSYALITISRNVSRSKRFVMVIGGVLVLSFFIRCVLFVIILAVEFKSSIYMFITLMITEVFLLFFLQLQFNSARVRGFLGGSGGTSSTFGSQLGSGAMSAGVSLDD